MTDTVWLVINPGGGGNNVMHSDKDCPRLSGAMKVLEKERIVVESHRDMCKWCSGEANPGKREEDPVELKNLLLDMDRDEVGT